MQSYGAVILAAGFSRRLPGEDKLLKTYRGRALLAHVLETVAGLGLGDAVIVTGDAGARIGQLARPWRLRCVANDDAAAGMGGSIAAGVCALPEGLAGIFVALGDMPEVAPEDYARLAATHEQRPARICVPVWDGRRGHPVLFGAAHRDALAALSGDAGARSVLQRAGEVVSVRAVSAGVLIDLDTHADFTDPTRDGRTCDRAGG